MPSQERRARDLALKLRRTRFLDMAIQGGTTRGIAQAWEGETGEGLSHETVARDIRIALKTMADPLTEEANDLRQVYTERYSSIYRRLIVKALGRPSFQKPDGSVEPEIPMDYGAMDRAMSVLKSLRDLWGLDLVPGSSPQNPLHVREQTLAQLYAQYNGRESAGVPMMPYYELPPEDHPTNGIGYGGDGNDN